MSGAIVLVSSVSMSAVLRELVSGAAVLAVVWRDVVSMVIESGAVMLGAITLVSRTEISGVRCQGLSYWCKMCRGFSW